MLRDIKPYICTYPGCPQSELLFSSRDEWLEHEEWEHRKRFSCPEHVNQSFQTSREFQIHVEESPHVISAGLSFDALADVSRSSDPDDRRVCPICLALLDNVDRLHNHIANHLERFAAFALPRDVDTVGDDEMSKGSKVSSGDSRAETKASTVLLEAFSISDKLSMVRKIANIILNFQQSLDTATQESPMTQTTWELLAHFNKDRVMPFAQTMSALLERNMEYPELKEPLDEAIRCLLRLQNLMDSLRIEDLLIEPQRVEDLTEPLDREHKILSKLFAAVRSMPQQTRAVRALFDFAANDLDELTFRKGDLIAVIESQYKDWWKGSLRGQVGIFPTNYVEKLTTPEAEDLKREAQLEEKVYQNVKDMEKLITLCSTAETLSPLERESGDFPVSFVLTKSIAYILKD